MTFYEGDDEVRCRVVERYGELQSELDKLARIDKTHCDDDHFTKAAVKCLEKVSNPTPPQSMVLEQLSLSSEKKFRRRYSNVLLIWSYLLYLNTPGRRFCVFRDLILLPCPRTLEKLSHGFRTDSSGSMSHYLKRLSATLTKAQCVVSLQIDEIHVKSAFSFKAGKIYGAAENASTAANCVQAFMIRSLFGKLQEVVSLIPVARQTGQQLKVYTLEVLEMLANSEFIVVCLVSDNNAVNRKLYMELGDENQIPTWIKNPYMDGKIFCILTWFTISKIFGETLKAVKLYYCIRFCVLHFYGIILVF